MPLTLDPHADWPDFDVWHAAFVEMAEQEGCVVNEHDPESYREYWAEGLSPLDAVMAEFDAAGT